jgi:hypothetical protein
MQQLFISHAEEDQTLAAEIAGALEKSGFSAWYYERDSVPGPSYLKQVIAAIAQCAGVIVIVSPSAMDSHIVDAELYRAFETRKRFVPLLNGISHAELEARMPEWETMFRAAATIVIPPAGVSAILGQIETGVKALGINPAPTPAPTPAEGSPERTSETAEESPGDEVFWAVFAPQEFFAGDAVLLQVWFHTPVQAEDVRQTAQSFDYTSQLRVKEIVAKRLKRGERLSVHLQVAALEIEEPTQEISWQGEPDSIHFAVAVPEASRPSNRLARVTLSVEGVPFGLLRFTLPIKEAAPPPDETAPPAVEAAPPAVGPAQSVERYRYAFLCYARADQAEVLRRAQMLSLMGISFFDDLRHLEIGEDWEKQIMRKIEEADVFLLFWSEAARQSREVEFEIHYALSLQQGDPNRPPRIIPVALELPMPPPPPALADLHFNDSLAYFVAQNASRLAK